MKHLIIIGAPRSGKSTLARMMRDTHGHNILCLDDLASAFEKNFPDVGVTIGGDLANSPLLISFVKNYVHGFTQWAYPGIPTIIEGVHISPKDAVELASIAPDQFQIIVLGYPNITVADKISQMRKHDGPRDWSSEETDEELSKGMTETIGRSQWLQQQCMELKIPFMDTSFERTPALEKFVSEFI